MPYVVEVDRLGEARAVTEVEAGYRPTDPQIVWHLAKFIENVRSVSLDPVLTRRDWLAAYPQLPFLGAADLDGGVAVYRQCRRAGVTPGGLIDCTIAAIAMRHDAALLTADVAQARIAQVLPLQLDPASVRP